MKINKSVYPNVNEPNKWKSYSAEKCQNCWAGCCTMPVEIRVEDLIRLGLCDSLELEEDGERTIAKKLVREGIVKNYREKTGLFMLEAQSNGDCIYLDSNRKCKVYEKRPDVCRKFPTSMGPRLNFCPYGPLKP